MENILFVGNGLNLLNSKISWKELLEQVQNECLEKYRLTEDKVLVPNDAPNTLQYESIFLSLNEKCRIIKSNRTIPSEFDMQLDLKMIIAEKMNDLGGNAIYDELIKMPFDHYITTNYDLSLDKTLKGNGWERNEGNSSEKIYSIRRYRAYMKGCKIKRIYPIHGDITAPKSIMIDYNHYCGTIAKISDYLKGNYKWDRIKDEKLKSIEERFLGNKNDYCEVCSWIDYFFRSNIYIVGFGFDWSEIELWWLLNRRKRFLQERNLKSKIYFYCLKSGKEEPKNDSICKMLELLGVTCRYEKVKEGNYLEAYKTIITVLKNDLYNNVPEVLL